MFNKTSFKEVRRLITTIPLLLLLLSVGTRAQYFSVFGIDDTKFPRMKARFVALDAAGNEYKNFSPGEFNLQENGTSYNSKLTVACYDTLVEPAANVVLILDRSGSMGTIVDTATKETRMDWVISGASTFLNTFKFVPPSQVAVVSFGTQPTFESPFRNTAPPLISVIQKLKPSGGTEYNPPMLDSSFGAIKLLKVLAQQNPGPRRIVIFLTDGQPDHDPLTDSIIKGCNAQSIQFYAITIGTKMNNDLATIAQKTGGKSFEAKTKADLEAIYRVIALETAIKQFCTIEWDAPYSCNQSGKIRDLKVTFTRGSNSLVANQQYLAPANSVANIAVSQGTLYFGDPAPGQSTTQTVTITAENAPFIVSSLTPSPSTYFTVIDYAGGKTLPDTIKKGDKRVVTIRFTQGGTKAYQQSSLVVGGTPCPPTVSLFGGLSSVQVVRPNGAEVFSTCDTIDIRWAGVDPTQGINIFYAADGDKANPTWTLLKQNATGLSYKWKPPFAGKNFRIRMTAQPAPTYLWAHSIGSPFLDTCRSIALDETQFFVHVAGTYNDTLKVNNSNKLFPSYGAQDAFVARFDSDGNLKWIQNAGGTANDGAAGVTTDKQDGIYVAGFFSSKVAQFGSTQINLPPFDPIDFFLARYDSTGNTTWVRTGGGTTTSAGYAYSDSVAFENDSIYVYGHYKNKLRISGYPASPGYLEINYTPTASAPGPVKFMASFDKNGNIASLVQGFRQRNYTDSTTSDRNGNVYDAGYFRGTQNNGGVGVNLNSRGDYDCFVRKFGGQPGSSDSSDAVFKVSSPQLTFKKASIVCPTISVGQASDTTYVSELCNTGDIPLLILKNGALITGPNKEDFKLTSNYDDKVLFPGECVNVEVHFQPQTLDGNRIATLQITANCGNPASIELFGKALPPCSFNPDPESYIGAQSVNLSLTKNRPCLVRNNSALDYSGYLSLVGVNPDEFSIKLTSTGEVISSTSGRTKFDLRKTDCLAGDITFTPKGSGARTAVLKIEVPVECGNEVQMNLIGNGIAPQIKIDPVDFNLRRVLTSTTLPCTISNPDTLDALITSISLANADPNFILDASMVTLPLNLKKGANVQVNVIYSPQTEGPHGVYVNASVAGNTTPTQGQVKGEGFIPQIISYDINFGANPVGMALPDKEVVVTNTHSRADLFVASVANPDNAAFVYLRTPPTDTVLAPGGSLRIPIRCTPAAGTNVGKVVIKSDAAKGPSVAPRVDTTITLIAEGLQVDVDPQPSSFGDLLSCDTIETRSLTIKNSGSSAVDVDMSVSGDSTAFDIQPPLSKINLLSNASKTYVIRCRALSGSHQMSLKFGLPSGTVNRDFSYNGISTPLVVKSEQTIFQVNGRNNYPIEFSTATLKGVTVQSLEFDVRFDSTSVLFDTARFKTLYANPVNNWKWTYSMANKNAPLVRIKGVPTTGFTGGSYKLQLPMWLLQVFEIGVPVTVTWANQPEYPCFVPDISNGGISAKLACFSAGSRIQIGGVPFGMQVAPNPISSSKLNVQYSIGIPVDYHLELYNAVGQRVGMLDEGSAEIGVYQREIDVSAVSNGMYYLRMSAGPYTETQVISINR